MEDIVAVLHKYGIKRDRDVCQLYLAKKELDSVPNLSRFKFLQHLWLNNNKIRKLNCSSIHCCLSELYLHNNSIRSISGALGHLSCVQVLHLHSNQLGALDDTMHELRRMQQLRVASFFLNPFCQEPEYRHYVIHSLPPVQILDRREVKRQERISSFRMFSGERHRILQRVAFGRRATQLPMETRPHRAVI